jgi:hypothetical protein
MVGLFELVFHVYVVAPDTEIVPVCPGQTDALATVNVGVGVTVTVVVFDATQPPGKVTLTV